MKIPVCIAFRSERSWLTAPGPCPIPRCFWFHSFSRRNRSCSAYRLRYAPRIAQERQPGRHTVRDDITAKLKGENAGPLAQSSLQYKVGFTLQPGVCSFKFLARENETAWSTRLNTTPLAFPREPVRPSPGRARV
jgi:hypothetical protein